MKKVAAVYLLGVLAFFLFKTVELNGFMPTMLALLTILVVLSVTGAILVLLED
jgi:hypothetical protein